MKLASSTVISKSPSVIYIYIKLLCCMFFANFSGNDHPIVIKFGKHYFLVFQRLPFKFHEETLCSLNVRPFDT